MSCTTGCCRFSSLFLSTLPARGATATSRDSGACGAISIHAPREGSDLLQETDGTFVFVISIHAPREGSDALRTFQFMAKEISIHAPREGSDSRTTCPAVERQNFYPRSPRGERRAFQATERRAALFLSTLPARGATLPGARPRRPQTHFYPRSPRGERPYSGSNCTPPRTHFYPRSPRGERL